MKPRKASKARRKPQKSLVRPKARAAAAEAPPTPRERARKGLADAVAQVNQSFDDIADLSRTASALTANRLDPANNSLGRLAADLTALSLNALAPFARFLGGKGLGTEVIKPKTPLAIQVAFDSKSEAAGPITVDLSEPNLALAAKQPLVGTGTGLTISPDQMIVRLAQNNKLIFSLRDLTSLAVGDYVGSIQLVRETGENLDITVTAQCKPKLWWAR